jgi:hypothetical protein
MISFFPFPNFEVEDLKNCIAKYNYIFLVPTSLTTRGSHNPGMGLLKVVGNYAYKKNIPIFIDLLTMFKTSRSPQMTFLPVSELFVKIFFKDSSEFDELTKFLRQTNTNFGHTLFAALRYGESEHDLSLRSERAPRSLITTSTSSTHSLPPRNIRRGHFLTIQGLPLYYETNLLIEGMKEKGLLVINSHWGKNGEKGHRFITELKEPPSIDLPKIIGGIDVEITYSDMIEDWENGNRPPPDLFKYLEEAPTDLGHKLSALFSKTELLLGIVPADSQENKNPSEQEIHMSGVSGSDEEDPITVPATVHHRSGEGEFSTVHRRNRPRGKGGNSARGHHASRGGKGKGRGGNSHSSPTMPKP